MANPASATEVLDREFLGIRSLLIQLAAALDRVDRADGSVDTDPRWLQIRRSLDRLSSNAAGRAEGVEMLFSLPFDEKDDGRRLPPRVGPP
jgi:hypothetical protein